MRSERSVRYIFTYLILTWPCHWHDRAAPFLRHLYLSVKLLLVSFGEFLMSQYPPPKEHKNIN